MNEIQRKLKRPRRPPPPIPSFVVSSPPTISSQQRLQQPQHQPPSSSSPPGTPVQVTQPTASSIIPTEFLLFWDYENVALPTQHNEPAAAGKTLYKVFFDQFLQLGGARTAPTQSVLYFSGHHQINVSHQAALALSWDLRFIPNPRKKPQIVDMAILRDLQRCETRNNTLFIGIVSGDTDFLTGASRLQALGHHVFTVLPQNAGTALRKIPCLGIWPHDILYGSRNNSPPPSKSVHHQHHKHQHHQHHQQHQQRQQRQRKQQQLIPAVTLARAAASKATAQKKKTKQKKKRSKNKKTFSSTATKKVEVQPKIDSSHFIDANYYNRYSWNNATSGSFFQEEDAEEEEQVQVQEQTVSTQNNKTEICQRWKAGTCKHGADCTYAHGVHDLVVHKVMHVMYSENDGESEDAEDEIVLLRAIPSSTYSLKSW